MDDDGVSGLDRFFEKRRMEKYALREDSVLVDHKEFCDDFLVPGAFLYDISDNDLDRVFLLDIYIRKCIQDAARVL